MQVLDLLAGTGYTSQLLALAVAPYGKVWAQSQGIEAVRTLGLPADFLLLTDADIGVLTGETPYTAVPGVLAVLKELKPSRIGHGVAAAGSAEALAKLAEAGTVLEICPSSNLRTHAVPNLEALGAALRAFEGAGLRYTINTDGPYLLNTHLRFEYQMLLDAGILAESQVEQLNAVARAATFIK